MNILACVGCSAPLGGARRSYCSDRCRARVQSQEWRNKQPGRLASCVRCATEWRYKSGGGPARPLCPACETTHKRCYFCAEVKPRDEYFLDKNVRDGLSARCKPCSVASARRYVKPARRRDYRLKVTYGITQGEYERQVSEQGGCCAICQQPTASLHIDHCHTTGRNRGLLCNKCNTGIGLLNEDPAVLRGAIDYLARYRD